MNDTDGDSSSGKPADEVPLQEPAPQPDSGMRRGRSRGFVFD